MKLGKRIRLLLLIAFEVGVLSVPASTAVYPSADLPDQTERIAQFDDIPADCSQPVEASWTAKVDSIKWVAYSSPNPNPGGGYYQPSAEAITNDLLTLKKAGFTGLITYGASGSMGKGLVPIAESLGYQGILMGLWDPRDAVERNNAVNAAASPIVLGYSIGNEGLGDTRPRYSVEELCAGISALRAAVGKPVATSEDIEMYYRWPGLRAIGDWVFAISHPYWHFTKFAPDAIQWEQDQYAALVESLPAERFVFFKEVGLPSEGAFGLTEANQDAYYRGLAHTGVRFAYFEGFDQPSKARASVEPHWGIFHPDLTPKLLAWNMMGYRIFGSGGTPGSWVEDCSRKNESNCTAHGAGTLLLVGDDRDDRQYRSFVSFDTSGLPDDAVITSIKLKLKSAGVVGLSPVTERRALMVDVCRPPMNKTVRYQVSDFRKGLACETNLGIFPTESNRGWYTVDLLPAAFSSVDLHGITQFRLRLSGHGVRDATRAYIQFYSGDAAEDDEPILLVKYDVR